jgi:hypothetical protein
MNRILSVVAALTLFSGCGVDESVKETKAAVQQAVDLTAPAREAAAIDAVKARFQVSVKEAFLDQGMTVRGVARVATQKLPANAGKVKTKTPADLHASLYDATASASQKLEQINGKIIYTALATLDDPAAAFIQDGAGKWFISYEVEAKVTPEGELKDFVFHHLGEGQRR